MNPFSVFKRIQRKGVLNSVELIFNRIVPAELFRFSVGDVFELDLAKLKASQSGFAKTDMLLQSVHDSEERDTLRSVTWNTVPIDTTENDHGYAISQTGNPTEFLGGVWGGVESFTEQNLGFRIDLENDQGWIYCAYIDKSLRGKGAYQRLLGYAASDLAEHGIERLYVVIQPWNHTSIHVHRKYSERRIGRIIVIRMFKLVAVFKTGLLRKSQTLTTQLEKDPVVFRLP